MPPWAKYQQASGPWVKYDAPQDNGSLGDSVADFFQSIPRGAVSGFTGALANIGKSAAVDAQFSGVPTANPDEMPTGPQGLAEVEKAVGPMHKPQGRAGRVGAAIGEGLGNPATYLGPGGLPLKIVGSALSSAGSEIGGQAAEGTPYEGAARVGGALAGGIAAAKTVGAPVKAAAPTYRELKDAATAGYNEARNTGLTLNTRGVSNFAQQVEQDLASGSHGFSGGQYGTSPKTFGVLHALQQPPAGATVGASNLDSIRKNLALIARETSEGKPTSDAAAASVALEKFNDYLENLPQNHIVAGSAMDYVRATKQANANYGAAQRVRNVEQKLGNAQDNYEGQIAGNLASQVKSQLRPILKNSKSQRGFTPEEIAAVRGVNRGTVTSNILSQLGRAGAGVVPLSMQVAAGTPTALMTGGASIAPQVALAAALYGARKGGEALTRRQASKLVELLAKRSPLYEERARALPLPDQGARTSALIRALIAH